ncbi:unnamed protein product, partial [Hapterophycus canaliculatus]
RIGCEGPLRFVRFKIGLGITYRRGSWGSVSLAVFVDSNSAPDAANRRFASGFVVMYAGGSVSDKQK